MSSYGFGGSIEFKSEIEGYEEDPILYGGYPFGIPKVYLNGDGECNTKFPVFDWEEDSVVVVRGKHILEYMSLCYREMLFLNNEGEAVWVDGRRVANEECEEMEHLGEVRNVKKYTITEYDVENGNKRTYSVTLDGATTMTGRDYDRLSCVVGAEVLGSHFEIEDGVLRQYIGNDIDLVIPADVTEISLSPFKGCGRFNSIKIPKTVTYISPSFFKCCEVMHVEVDADNPKYYSQDGFLIDRETKTLVWAYSGTTIPNDGSIIKIGSYAFHSRSDIKKIEIPDTISEIDDKAIHCCYMLEEIKIPSVFADDAQRIFGASLVKNGDVYRPEGDEYTMYKKFGGFYF